MAEDRCFRVEIGKGFARKELKDVDQEFDCPRPCCSEKQPR
jgi:hypothetical protein